MNNNNNNNSKYRWNDNVDKYIDRDEKGQYIYRNNQIPGEETMYDHMVEIEVLQKIKIVDSSDIDGELLNINSLNIDIDNIEKKRMDKLIEDCKNERNNILNKILEDVKK